MDRANEAEKLSTGSQQAARAEGGEGRTRGDKTELRAEGEGGGGEIEKTGLRSREMMAVTSGLKIEAERCLGSSALNI